MNKSLAIGLGLALGLAALCCWGLLAGQARRADERLALLAGGRIRPTIGVLQGELEARSPGRWQVSMQPAYLLLRTPALLAGDDLAALEIRELERPALLRIDCEAQATQKIHLEPPYPKSLAIPACAGRTLGLWIGPGRSAVVEIELVVAATRQQAAADLLLGRIAAAPVALAGSWTELLFQPHTAPPRLPQPAWPALPTLTAPAAALALAGAALTLVWLRSGAGRVLWIVALPLPLLLVREPGDAHYPLLLLFVAALAAAVWGQRPQSRLGSAARSAGADASTTLGWLLAGMACVILLAPAAFQPNALPKLSDALRYLVFAALQQTWLLAGVLRAAPPERGDQRIVWASAAMALAHWPNPPLMALTATLAVLTSTLYLRGAGLASLALLHAASGLAAQAWISGLSLRAGWAYLDG